MSKAAILVIDDDEHIQTVVSHYLEDDGYTVMLAGTGHDALKIAEQKITDVVLLDLGLPDIDGLSLITRLRAINDTPIIVVSGKDEATDKIVGLELGADDYVVKPFNLRELGARIKTVLRRINKDGLKDSSAAKEKDDKAEVIGFNGWVMNTGKFELQDSQGQAVDLTTGEFQLLHALVKSPNRALSRDQLFEVTRDADYDSFDRAIDIQIGRIRKKLKEDPKSPKLIKTIRGVGYMFIGDLDKTV